MVRLLVIPIFFVCVGLGALIGIIPGLLLGIPEWHEYGAIIIPLIWIIGFLKQRPAAAGKVGASTLLVVGGVGIGLGASVWFFGSLTS